MHKPAVTAPQGWDPNAEASALRTLNTFAVDLIGIPNSDDLFWYVAQNVVGRLNFVDCVIYQANTEGTDLQQVAAWGEKNPFGRSILNPLVIPFGQGITGQVAKTQEAIIIEDLLTDRNYIPDTQVARSEICVPLISHGRVVGVIDCEHPAPNAFGEAELEILSTIAAITGAKLELLAEAERSTQRYQELVTSHAQLTQEIAARKALEAKLFEVRKLEALGRLTGRFAHEFNNILTVILGNLEFLEFGTNDPESLGFLNDAKLAGGRGSRLMRDMLAFAQRTRLEPVVLDINALVTEFSLTHKGDLARDVDLRLAQDLWLVSADRKAMETVLFNLVENAKDATAMGGKVVIQTENIFHTLAENSNLSAALPAGRYVRLTVSDTGTGIPEQRLSQVFDPFFTTKPIGTGTGLGLSMVQGFTQQSGGGVTCKSEIGLGSRFQVCLPALPERGNHSLTKSG